MNYVEYVERFRRHGSFADLSEYGSVRENNRDYPLLRVVTEGDTRLIITSGFHGEEPAGPLTLLENLPEIVRYARLKGVGLSVYPCINPSGFESGDRYNASGEKPNNDFLRYEIKPGEWKDTLAPGEDFLQVEVFDGGPKETRLVREALKLEPTPVAALDIHQDKYLGKPLAYAYYLGPSEPMVKLMKGTADLVEVAQTFQVDDDHFTDAHGLIDAHDGSVTDYFFRRGVRFNATLETTTHTPMATAHTVNLLWIHGFIDLVAAATEESPE